VRHAHAVEISQEGVPLVVIQRQHGHADLGITRLTCAGSTTPKSSTRSTSGPHRRFRQPTHSGLRARPSINVSEHCDRQRGAPGLAIQASQAQ
jgi:hypothetical protein